VSIALLSRLNVRERVALGAIRSQYVEQRTAKNYAVSDKLRADLESRGCIPPDYSEWHPVFETPQARTNRAAGRYAYGD
jgi:hypothetical protein